MVRVSNSYDGNCDVITVKVFDDEEIIRIFKDKVENQGMSQTNVFRMLMRQYIIGKNFNKTTVCDVPECDFNTLGLCGTSQKINKKGECKTLLFNMKGFLEMKRIEYQK